MPPSVLATLGLGARAAARCAWLAPVGMAVALLRGALTLPAALFAFAVVQLAAAGWSRGVPLPALALEGAIAAATSPRFLALAGGLWAAGALAGAALRVAYLAGALPTLARELAGAPIRPVFAAGFVHGFARVLPAAALAAVLELAALAGLAGAALAAALVAGTTPSRPLALAALGAAAVASAAVVSVAAGAVADATLARAAVRGEGPGRALARAAQRFVRRPAAFLAVALAAFAADLALGVSAQATAAIAGGVALAHPLVAAGPQLLASALALLAAAAVELWRLAAVTVLACGRRA